tara:strand:- start:1382 stop:1603 length:222 start_codon:yes stop_codon:yes gene_type:complete
MALKNPKNKPLNKFLRFTGIGIQLGATIYIFSYFGKKLDAYFGFEKVITLSMVLFAFVISMYSILQQLKKMED